MTEDKSTDTNDGSNDEIVIEVQRATGAAPADPDPVEKGEDFSSDTASEAESESPAEGEEQLRQRIAELEDRLLRTAADFENYRKRMARQYEDMARASNDRILTELLEIIDNFERARLHSTAEAELESLLKGNELIHNQMVALLAKYDITPIEAVGQPFDPNVHDAMLQIESEEFPDGVVAQEISKGYRQGNRILRHSRVAVSKGKG